MKSNNNAIVATYLDDDDLNLLQELRLKLTTEKRRLITNAELLRIALRDCHHTRVVKTI